MCECGRRRGQRSLTENALCAAVPQLLTWILLHFPFPFCDPTDSALEFSPKLLLAKWLLLSPRPFPQCILYFCFLFPLKIHILTLSLLFTLFHMSPLSPLPTSPTPWSPLPRAITTLLSVCLGHAYKFFGSSRHLLSSSVHSPSLWQLSVCSVCPCLCFYFVH